MADWQKHGKPLFPIALGSALGVIGLASSAPQLPAASIIVAQLVSGLAINYTSERISSLLKGDEASTGPGINYDLDRVATHALLTILYEVLGKQGIEPDPVIRQVGKVWNLELFREPVPDSHQLVELLRMPGSLPEAQATEIARAMLPYDLGHLRMDFGAAIAERFASTFEALLRSDERAYRAATIYLQRLELQELGQMRKDLAAVFQALMRPQPVLERFEALRKDSASGQAAITDLQFKRRATRYRPRANVTGQIQEWLLSADRLRILKITGPAGMGKSRLALELCDWCHAEHWLAGFASSSDWPKGWIPLRDTLIVVDYAAFHRVGGGSAFEWLESIFLQNARKEGGGAREARVRIVLVDRMEQGPLWSEWESSEIAKDLDSCTVSIALEPERSEFEVIVRQDLERRLGRHPDLQELQAIDEVTKRLREQYRPLFALLTAAALADSTTHRKDSWSPELLVESILKAQVKLWSVAGITDEHLDLLFEATLTQGSCNAVPEFRKKVEGLHPSVLAALRALSEPSGLLGPISPDLLGEFFLLMRLRGEASTLTRQAQLTVREAQEVLDRCWENEQAVMYAAFLLQDYLGWKPEHGENPAGAIRDVALRRIDEGHDSAGLLLCCFFTVGKEPQSRDWVTWATDLPEGKRGPYFGAVMAGFVNASLANPELADLTKIVDTLDVWYNSVGKSLALRPLLSNALYNLTNREADDEARNALILRIESLLEDEIPETQQEHGAFAVSHVRESLARALANETGHSVDATRTRSLVARIEALHLQDLGNSNLRFYLAGAWLNEAIGEGDGRRRLELTARIEGLHSTYGNEAIIREVLARALEHTAKAEEDPVCIEEIAGRLDRLHTEFDQPSELRARLGRVLCHLATKEADLSKRRTTVRRLRGLYEAYGHEVGIAIALAKALERSIEDESDPARCREVFEQIIDLQKEHRYKEIHDARVVAILMYLQSVLKVPKDRLAEEMDQTSAFLDRIMRENPDLFVRNENSKAIAESRHLESLWRRLYSWFQSLRH
ncbi:MAG: hypothetical protein U0R19_33920 [Bryobacteraceae bacterium]